MNVNFYIDTLNKICIRLDFVKTILKLEIKKLLKFIETLLQTTYFAIFKYFVNKKLINKSISTSYYNNIIITNFLFFVSIKYFRKLVYTLNC